MGSDGSQLRGKGFDANPQNINRKGRPRKPVLSMKVEGYKLYEINDTIQAIVGMTQGELKQLLDNPKSTLLERTIAQAIKKSIEKGNLDSLETLLNRVYGKPSQKVDITTDGEKLNNKIQIEVITSGNTKTNLNG